MEPAKEVNFEKIYDAPIEQVWQAWTDPEALKQWWGPENVIIPECEVDLRVGGRFYIVMEAGEGMGPYQGTRWPMDAAFTAVEPKTRLAYAARAWTEGQEATTEIDVEAELILQNENNKTKMTFTVTINKIGPGAKMAAEGMQWGYNQQFDKLAAFLAK